MQIITNEELAELRAMFIDLDDSMSDEAFDPFAWRETAGDTCLHIAVLRNNLRGVQLLVKGGIGIDIKGDMGCTALHNAGRRGFQDIFDYLVLHGASTETKNDFGKTPLEYASENELRKP